MNKISETEKENQQGNIDLDQVKTDIGSPTHSNFSFNTGKYKSVLNDENESTGNTNQIEKNKEKEDNLWEKGESECSEKSKMIKSNESLQKNKVKTERKGRRKQEESKNLNNYEKEVLSEKKDDYLQESLNNSEENNKTIDTPNKEMRELDFKYQQNRLEDLKLNDSLNSNSISEEKQEWQWPNNKKFIFNLRTFKSNKTSLQNNILNKMKKFAKRRISKKRKFKVFSNNEVIKNTIGDKFKRINNVENDNDTDDEILRIAMKWTFQDLNKILKIRVKNNWKKVIRRETPILMKRSRSNEEILNKLIRRD